MASINQKLSLVESARQKRLPPHQFMDEETLIWLKSCNPFLGSFESNNFKMINISKKKIIEKVIKYAPKESWFFSKKQLNGIHGMRHILRVLIYVQILFHIKKISGEIKNYLIAASLHDIRRIHDKDDVLHGKRSAEWFIKNISRVSQKIGKGISTSDEEKIYWGIYYHEIPYSKLRNDKNYKFYKDIVDVVKTSDALDRYRLPKTKWWIKDEFLYLLPPKKIKIFAYNFVVKSEETYLKTKNNFKSIVDTLKRI